MESFYRHLREGLTNTEALRAAQVAVMGQETWAEPYYWAAFSLTGDYTRSTLHSDISYLVPQTLQPATSLYREHAHVGTAVLDVKLPQVRTGAPALSLGGSLFKSAGSRASHFYQPFGRLSVPLHRKISVFGQWRWYSYAEQLYPYEDFQTHHFILGLRLGV